MKIKKNPGWYPQSEIVKEAEDDGGINLIVIRPHGRTGPGHVILGSVAENVIRHSYVTR
ncbi:universal stress protein [Methanopyrus sp.]